jgi:hypothetical protein
MRDVRKRLSKLEPQALAGSEFDSLSDEELDRELKSARQEFDELLTVVREFYGLEDGAEARNWPPELVRNIRHIYGLLEGRDVCGMT